VTETATQSRPAEDAGRGSLIGWGAARRRAKAAHDTEFTAFVESASTRLRRSAYLMCRDWHLAQDLTQQTFAKISRYTARGPASAPAPIWRLTAARS
jgi:DNA-directed RNA polymerase specialized sigma24 family protein